MDPSRNSKSLSADFVHPGRVLLAVILAGTLLRVFAGASLGLGIDEQYALAVGRQFQWSFLDHPPLGFWLGTLMWQTTGSTEPLLLRLPFILLAIVTTLLLYRFTRAVFGSAPAVWAAVLFNLAPLFSIVAGSWLMPDGPLLAAAIGSACCLLPVIRETPEKPLQGMRAWRVWLAAGALLGVAMLAKYLAVFYGLGVCLYIFTMPKSRHWLRHPAPYVGVLLAVVVFSPVLVWNASHGWSSFAFQAGRAIGDGGLKPGYVLQMILGAALYLLPWLWLPLLVEGVKAGRAGRVCSGAWFCVCIALPTILALSFIPLWGQRGLPHWPAIGFFFLLPVLGRATASWLKSPGIIRKRAVGWLAFSVVLVPLITVALVTHARYGWATGLIPVAAQPKDPTLDTLSWKPLEGLLREAGLNPEDPELVVATLHWIEAARVGASLSADWKVVVANQNAHHFQFLHKLNDHVGGDVVFVGTPGRLAGVEQFSHRFDSMEPLGSVDIKRGGKKVMEVGAVLGHRLGPLP